MKLTVDVDVRATIANLRALGSEVGEQATVRALNRTAITVRAVAAREIVKDLKPALRIGDIKAAIHIDRATRGNLVAVVKASGRKRIPLGAFPVRQTKEGVYARAPGISNRVVPHAFIRQRNGRTVVLIRSFDPKAMTYGTLRPRFGRGSRIAVGRSDLPVAEVYVPGVPAIFVQPRVMNALRKVVPERFAEVLGQEVRFRGG